MNLAEVMQELADQLDTIAGLNAFGYPADTISPPAAMVDYPDGIEFDATYGRGSDTMVVPVYVAVGKASDRAARDTLGAYADGAGAKSVKQVLEAGAYEAFDTCRVSGAEFAVITVGAVDYLAAKFTVDITGPGE